MTALTRPLVLAAVIFGLVVLAAPTLLRHAPDARDKLQSFAGREAEAGRQSASQISSAEFESIQPGSTPRDLRALVGEPASTASSMVEGVEVECLYYGVGGATGAYQLCFVNGRLATKLRYSKVGAQ